VEPDLKKAGAIVYAMSNEDSSAQIKMRDLQKLGKTFVFLTDPDAKMANLYAGRGDRGTVLKPATFVIGKDKKIAYAYVTHNGEDHPPVQDVVKAVQAAAVKR
jgi:peroxiredoxin